MSSKLQTRQRTVVVDFSRGSIKMALAETACEAVRFQGITTILVPRASGETAANGEIAVGSTDWIADQIKNEVRRKGWGGMPCACLLSRTATSTQSFQFPAMPDAEMREAIAMKLEETLHFELDQACFDFRRIREYEEGGHARVLALVAAARSDAVTSALQTLRHAGLVPVAIGAAAESLANLASLANLCEEEATIHVDMGSESTILNLFEGRLLRFSREIDTAGEAITQAFMRPIITPDGIVRLTHEQAEEVKKLAGYPDEDDRVKLPHGLTPEAIRPLVEPVLQRLAGELRRSSSYLCSMLQRGQVDSIVLSGPSGQMKNLDKWLAEAFDTPVTYTDPVARAIAHWRLAVCDQAQSAPAGYAGFAAILGYSLGSHRPINLMPRGERMRQGLQQNARTFRRFTPIAAGVGLCMAAGAVPIHLRYGAIESVYQETQAGQLERLETDTKDTAREAGDLLEATQIAQARGAVPNWSGLMKEIAAILPKSVQLTEFRVERTDSGAQLAISGAIPKSTTSFGDRLAAL
ncbi:MAG: type IV pilus assembly protein PilM, partial [Chlamydiales bacterium]